MSSSINATTAAYCYIDLDIDGHREKLGACAAFVHATDARYGFSSKDLRALGGSELSRIPELASTDHEWSGKLMETKPPPAGSRIILKLDWEVAPLACENFATLCANGSGGNKAPLGQCGKPLTYRDSTVHRIIPGFVIQGGDFVFGNGSGGESIFGGKKFKDERAGLIRKHNTKGILSMGNSGKNSNSSQFFITFQAAPQCDSKHVIFGKMVSGFEVLDYAESVGTPSGDPSVPVIITDCGIYNPLKTPGAGYWYNQPDSEVYTGMSPVFIVRVRVVVVAPSNALVQRFQKALEGFHVMVETMIIQSEDGESAAVIERLISLLREFSVDIVLVAPACVSTVSSFTLPPTYPPREQVILESKPVEALAVIRTKSWFVKQQVSWRLDGGAS